MSKSNNKSCMTCHTGLANAPETSLPSPQMANCQAQCHNGKTSFTATGTNCTKCHTYSGKLGAEPLVLGDLRKLVFSHQTHRNRGVDMAQCSSCHQLRPDGNIASAGSGKDHKPCSDSGCHEREFFSKTNKICIVCHASEMKNATGVGGSGSMQIAATIPWQKPPLASLGATFNLASELPGPMNHRVHLSNAQLSSMPGNGACMSCHGDKLAGGVDPKGHSSCARCHNAPAGVAPGKNMPAMTNCQSCHQLGATLATRTVSPWSVADNFNHKDHSRDPQKNTVPACAECHSTVANATDLAGIAAPKMQTCDRCHNGKDTFKTTGFDCSRCHKKGQTQAGASAALQGDRGPSMQRGLSRRLSSGTGPDDSPLRVSRGFEGENPGRTTAVVTRSPS